MTPRAFTTADGVRATVGDTVFFIGYDGSVDSYQVGYVYADGLRWAAYRRGTIRQAASTYSKRYRAEAAAEARLAERAQQRNANSATVVFEANGEFADGVGSHRIRCTGDTSSDVVDSLIDALRKLTPAERDAFNRNFLSSPLGVSVTLRKAKPNKTFDTREGRWVPLPDEEAV